MTTALLYLTISAALYYLASRAKLTHFLWSRYPEWLAYWTLCSACSAFAYGVGLGALGGQVLHLDFLGLDGTAWYTPGVVGLCTMVWTPILARHMVECWMLLLTTDEDDDPDGERAPTVPLDLDGFRKNQGDDPHAA